MRRASLRGCPSRRASGKNRFACSPTEGERRTHAWVLVFASMKRAGVLTSNAALCAEVVPGHAKENEQSDVTNDAALFMVLRHGSCGASVAERSTYRTKFSSEPNGRSPSMKSIASSCGKCASGWYSPMRATAPAAICARDCLREGFDGRWEFRLTLSCVLHVSRSRCSLPRAGEDLANTECPPSEPSPFVPRKIVAARRHVTGPF